MIGLKKRNTTSYPLAVGCAVPIDEPRVPVVACGPATAGFEVPTLVAVPVEVLPPVLGVVTGEGSAAARLPPVEVVEVDELVEVDVLVEVDEEEAGASAVVVVLDVAEEAEEVDEDDEDDEVDEDDEAPPPAAEVRAVSDALSLPRAAGGEAAAMISAGVGTCRGACPGSTCTVCPGYEITVRSIPSASREVTLCAPVSVWLKVAPPSRLARMLPDPRIPTVARLVFIL